MGYWKNTPANEVKHLTLDFIGQDYQRRPILTDGQVYYTYIDGQIWTRQGDPFSEPSAPLDTNIGFTLTY